MLPHACATTRQTRIPHHTACMRVQPRVRSPVRVHPCTFHCHNAANAAAHSPSPPPALPLPPPITNERQVLKIRITGMVCAACSTEVENALVGHPGVSKVAVSLAQGEAEITFDSGIVTTVRGAAPAHRRLCAGRRGWGGGWV